MHLPLRSLISLAAAVLSTAATLKEAGLLFPPFILHHRSSLSQPLWGGLPAESPVAVLSGPFSAGVVPAAEAVLDGWSVIPGNATGYMFESLDNLLPSPSFHPGSCPVLTPLFPSIHGLDDVRYAVDSPASVPIVGLLNRFLHATHIIYAQTKSLSSLATALGKMRVTFSTKPLITWLDSYLWDPRVRCSAGDPGVWVCVGSLLFISGLMGYLLLEDD